MVLSLVCLGNVEAADCTPHDIQLSSQSEVDDFQADHGPDCDAITGNLTIAPAVPENGSDIDNLGGLAGIQVIQGGLVIRDIPGLTDISQLESLVSIGGDLEVQNNGALSNCQALNVLLDGYYDGVLEPAPPIPDVGGEVQLGGNTEGCNSVEDIAPTPVMARAMTGSWYSPSYPGVGFMWHAVNDELAVAYYYGFTDKGEFNEEGDRFWLIGVHEGPIDWGHLVTFESYYVSGGEFENLQSSLITEHYFGEINLSVACETSGLTITGTFPGTESPQSYLSGGVRLAPVAGYECYRTDTPTHPTDGLTGSWYDPATSGQGFAVHKVDDETGIIYFYGFDRRGERLWLIGVWDGPVSFGEELTITMNEVSGGRFLFFNADRIVESEWGVLRIRFDNCTTGWAELVGADGYQEFELGLLAASAGLECAD